MSLVVVTGANRGIGLEFTKRLCEQGHDVVAVCRNSSPELAELSAEVISGIDVTSDESIKALKDKIGGRKIALLINNAGILRDESLQNMDFNSIVEQFNVNTLGPLRVTTSLLDNLDTNSKIAMITSRMGSMADNDSGGRYGYRISKAALNMASTSLALDLKERQIAVAILHPGWVKTDMTGHTGLLDTKSSVDGMLKNIEKLSLENTGTFWHTNGEKLPW